MSDKTKNLSQIVKELIQDVDIDDNAFRLLQLKTSLRSAIDQQLEEVVNNANIRQFCNDLNEFQDQHYKHLIVSVFDDVFDLLKTDYILNNYHNEIINGLNAKNDTIVELWLKRVDRCLAQELALNHTICSKLDINSLLLKLIELMAKPEISKTYCHRIILNIAKSNELSHKFFEPTVQNKLIEMKKDSDEVRMRIYDLLVAIASTSHKNFYCVEGFGHFKDILREFNESDISDPLLTLNVLQIVTDLGSTSFGAKYLESSDILKTIAERMTSAEDDIFGNIVIPGYIKVFGSLASNEPTVLDKYPKVMEKLKKLLEDLDLNLVMTAIDTIAVICYKNSGKILVNKDNEMCHKFMSKVGSILQNGSTDMKKNALIALSHLLRRNESDPTSEATAFAESWFRCLLPNKSMSTLLSLCRQPFQEIKLQALECLRVLATYVWGHKELAAFPGFLDYILDRKTETTKEGKEAKYQVIRELVMSPFIDQSFTKEAVQRLKAYYKEGPYYVDNQPVVSFEGAN